SVDGATSDSGPTTKQNIFLAKCPGRGASGHIRPVESPIQTLTLVEPCFNMDPRAGYSRHVIAIGGLHARTGGTTGDRHHDRVSARGLRPVRLHPPADQSPGIEERF